MYVMGTHVLRSPGEMLSRVILDDSLIMHNTVKKSQVLNEKSGIMGLDSDVEDLSSEGNYYLGDLNRLVVDNKNKIDSNKKTIYVSDNSRQRGISYYLHDSQVNSHVIDVLYTVDDNGTNLELLGGFRKITEMGLRDIDDNEILKEIIPILDTNYNEIIEDIGIIYEKLVIGIIRHRKLQERQKRKE